ncbi:hypothetical protein ACQP1P_43330 [Dactylosporangium sp. CA-052675]|uniref:hypothetical protein n=1 Tax=Dactylosporangium sp. CA-052675 TaxID=3239927 RepID=UPI003D931284
MLVRADEGGHGMTAHQGGRLHRWTARALVGGAAVASALAFGSAAAAPPRTVPGAEPARVVSGVVVAGVASVTLLLLLAGTILVVTPRLIRLVRIINARRQVR